MMSSDAPVESSSWRWIFAQMLQNEANLGGWGSCSNDGTGLRSTAHFL